MLPRQSSHSAAIGPGVTGGPLAHPTPVNVEQQHQRNAPQAPTCGSEAFVVDPSAVPAGDFRKHTQYVLDRKVFHMRDHLFILLYSQEAPSHSILSFAYHRYPYVTGTSVLGITYKDGVLIACDTLGKQPPFLDHSQLP